MSIQRNHSLSADCVVFGFSGTHLKVLLVDKKYPSSGQSTAECKLPGGMLRQNETLPDAAARILFDYTGLNDIFLKQTFIFSDPNRVSAEDIEWINEFHNINTTRVVTVGFYALVKLNKSMIEKTSNMNARWVDVDKVRHLALDHTHILSETLNILYQDIKHTPIIYEFLPRKFTITELQTAYSIILGVDIDNRNFRKKILNSGYLVATGRKEVGVKHKPAEFYTFNKSQYEKVMKDKFKLGFI